MGEGDDLPRGVRGYSPPGNFILRQNFENVTVCALTSSRLDDFFDIVTHIL